MQFLSEKDRDAALARVLEAVQRHHPVHLLTGLAFPNLLLPPADGQPAIIEFLHHLVLTNSCAKYQDMPSEEYLEGLFSDIRMLFACACVNGANAVEASARGEMESSLTLDSLHVRGKSYPYHQSQLIARLFGCVEDWLYKNMRITASDAVLMVRELFESLNTSVNATLEAAKAQGEGSSQSAFFTNIIDSDMFRLPNPADNVRRVFEFLSASPGSQPLTEARLPGQVWPTSRDYPILAVDDHLYCFNPQAVVDELPRLLGKWIAARDKRYYDKKYARRREDLLTDVSIECLQCTLPGAQTGKNLYYGQAPANRCETDALVIYDDIAIVIESKAGSLSFPARRGFSKRIERDFRELIGKAYSQASRTADFIRDHSSATFTDAHGRPALKLPGRTFRRIYVLIPLLDTMDAMAMGLSDARSSGLLDEGKEWPWVVSINDLRLVTEMLDSPSAFFHYIDRRLRFNEHSAWFRVHDEVDLLDYFLRAGLFLEEKPFKGADVIQWQADTSALDKYYAAMMQGLKPSLKPRLPLIPEISEMLRDIESSGIPNRTALAVELLNYDENIHRQIVNMIPQLISRLALRHIPQRGHIHRPGFGVSLWFTEKVTQSIRKGLHYEDVCKKYDSHAHEWITAIFVVREGTHTLWEAHRHAEPWQEDPNLAHLVKDLYDKKHQMRGNSKDPGRNDPCPCGSGKKFKKCHGQSV